MMRFVYSPVLFQAFFILLLANSLVYSQDKTVLDRLYTEPVSDVLYIRHYKGKFSYRLQDKKEVRYLGPKDIDLPEANFGIGNTVNRKGKVVLYLEFYNPLRQDFKSTITESDDPTSNAIAEFIAAIPTSVISLVDVTGGSAAAASPSKTAYSLSPTPATRAPAVNEVKFIASLLLYEWINEYQKIRNPSTAAPDIVKHNVVATQINKIGITEEYLYDKINIYGPTTKSVGTWVKDENKLLYDTGNDHEKFSTTLSQSKRVGEELESSKENAYKSLNDIIKFITDGFDSNVAPALDPAPVRATEMAAFKQYSQVVARVLARTTTADFKTQDEVVSKYGKLMETLDDHLNQFSEYETVIPREKIWYKQLDEVNIDKSTPKLKDYALVMTPRIIDGTPETDVNKLVKASFRFSLQKYFVPYVSTSAVFSPLSFPNYATEIDAAGVTRIGVTNPTRIVPRPVVFINFLNRFGKADPEDLAWHLQVGMSLIGKNYLFPVGVGLLLGGRISVSGGFMAAVSQDLQTKHPGELIKDETALQNDLGNRFNGSYYFSVNIPFGLGKTLK